MMMMPDNVGRHRMMESMANTIAELAPARGTQTCKRLMEEDLRTMNDTLGVVGIGAKACIGIYVSSMDRDMLAV